MFFLEHDIADDMVSENVQDPLDGEREEHDPDDTVNNLKESVAFPAAVLGFVHHCELDAHFQMAFAPKVQFLPLTKQLTNLAGNAWYHSNCLITSLPIC